ncbi:chemotaxis protein CheW [Sulfitobacter guttiformis]|uniref:CheW protein n=1 Tax=Sulfitobacter guttiformis TaxID=74349 RepID=A0A420DH44_9RHOB|nr:chemotaxis protein CheW [Sulfitobacter guttiformis]RKE93539.1 CheW protein [Sulfitobacter guttiformis]
MNDLSPTIQADILECVAFSVSGQLYCFDIMNIREIRRWAKVTTLPHADSHVLGVMNLRGNVVPVYDLSAHFGLGKTQTNQRNVVIIADVSGQTFGLLVESVSEIMAVSRNDVQATPAGAKGVQGSLIEGLISVGDDMAQLVDLKNLLSGSDMNL